MPIIKRLIVAFTSLYAFLVFQAQADDLLENQRKLFLDADRAISQGRITAARKIMDELNDYPLAPYLELEIMLRDLYKVPAEEVEAFISRHQDTWAGEKARLNWLVVLNARRKYQDYIRHYQHVEPSTADECNYLYALIKTGKAEEAYQRAPDIWLSGRSQPDACDKVFSHWRRSDAFSDEYVWQRFLLARRARQYGLARYLTSMVKNPEIQVRIEIYHRVRGNPSLAAKPSNFNLEKAGQIEIVEYGLRRIADSDPDTAYSSYQQYRELGIFDIVQQQVIIESLMKGWTEKDEVNKALELAFLNRDLIREQQLDWQLQQSLKGLHWEEVLSWAGFLDEESAQNEKWQYWIARAENQLGHSANQAYLSLAQKRSFYGHLASMISEQPFHLVDKYQPSDPVLVDQIKSSAGAQQARELDAVRFFLNSRNAWNVMLEPLSENGKIAAGQAAHEIGLHYSAIVSMAKTGYWENLTVRFPLAHQEHFEKAAKDNNISTAWVYGISRQESSFAVDIRSSAGARGLMQVMPGTAREMAKKIDVRYDRSRLRQPEYNIPLGAAYLEEGIQELDGNMIYATAGYNAGINRAKQWLKDGKNNLPLDVWIEIIPFKETRGYVKNVMAYSTIYADKLGIEAPLTSLSDQMFIGLK